MALGNAIRLMCRARKSREGDHFAAAIGFLLLLWWWVGCVAPIGPDVAFDQHTQKAKRMGRGLDHFRKEGAKLVPPPTDGDPYEAEAYRLWQIKNGSK